MTKEKILEEALKIYADHGYKGTTMKKIADAVGIKAASIYFFFQNKEDVLKAVFQIILERHHTEIEKIHATSLEATTIESIQNLVIGLARYHREDMVGTKAYVQLITSDRESFKEDFSSYTVDFMAWLFDHYEAAVKVSYPNVTNQQMQHFFEQIVILADGMFWSTIVYSDAAFEKRIDACKQMISTLTYQLERDE